MSIDASPADDDHGVTRRCPDLIDLHFHALPGIDDGPTDVEAAVALVRAAEDAGVDAIVATPHVSWEWPNTAQTIGASVRLLRAELAARSIGVRILPGAEVALTRGFELPTSELRSLRLGAGPWLLVEAPHAPGVAGVEDMLLQLQSRGLQIVLAHVERSPAFLDDAELLRRLVGSGMLASITAGSLTGRFGRDVKRAAAKFVSSGLIHNVSSDAHNTGSRAPGLLDDLDAAGLGAQAPWLTEQVPEAILRGAPIPPAPEWPAPPPTRRRLFPRR